MPYVNGFSVCLPCHFIWGGAGGNEPLFPSGQRELADWSGECMIDNLVGSPHRLPDSREEWEVLVVIAQMDMQLLTEGLLPTFTYLDAEHFDFYPAFKNIVYWWYNMW